MSGPGGQGGPSQIVADNLILSKPGGGGQIMPTNYYLLAPQIFRPSDIPGVHSPKDEIVRISTTL